MIAYLGISALIAELEAAAARHWLESTDAFDAHRATTARRRTPLELRIAIDE